VSLKNDAASGLRQRKAGGGAEPAGTAKQQQPAQEQAQAARGTEGVPVQIVALLCLVSFLLAYFFF
jgi:hypothetical protein